MTEPQPTPPSVQVTPVPAASSAPSPAATVNATAPITAPKPIPSSDPVQELDTSRASRSQFASAAASPAQFSSLMEAMLGGATAWPVVLGMGPPSSTTARRMSGSQSPKKKSSSGRRSPPEVRDVTDEEEDVGSQSGTPSLSESEVTDGDTKEQDGNGEEDDEEEEDEEAEEEEEVEGGALDSMNDPRLWAAMGLGAKPTQAAGMGGMGGAAAVATQMRRLEQYLEHIHHASGMLFHSRHISEIDTVALRQDLLGATEHPLEMYKAAVHALLAVIEMSQKVEAEEEEEEDEEEHPSEVAPVQVMETKSQPAPVMPTLLAAETAIPVARSHKHHHSTVERPRKRSSTTTRVPRSSAST